jgi:lipopolysaccharide export system protein LptC
MLGDESYSQFVGFLKITLPLAALALMSTVFLFARAPTQETTIPYAEIEEIARDPRLSGAQMSGVSEDGSVFELTARTTQPSGNTIITQSVAAGIETTDGTRIDILAGQGIIDNAAQTARLTGLARLETSNGFDMETSALTANLANGRIISDGALEVQAPFGSLKAGQLIIETPEGSDSQVILFQNGVRLIYTPQQ